MEIHHKYMHRCLQLAVNGVGTARPNPLVGSVIVHKDTIIGEGWHRKPGEAHAEVNAINSVKDKSLLTESAIYVNLEPCSHFGKTPPCADFIIENKIPRVVVGTVDPHSLVCGNGIKKLTDAGVQVLVGILEKECGILNNRFFTFMQKSRPYIILKWAETADGFLSPENRPETKPVWITNSHSRQMVHKWRSEEHAILVGSNTVIDDDPELTVRDWTGNNPIRIVLDRSGRLTQNYKVFNAAAQTLLFTPKPNGTFNNNVVNIVTDDFDISTILRILFENKITSVIVEGGATILQSFIESELWDEARVFIGQAKFGGGVAAPKLKVPAERTVMSGGDQLLYFKNA